MTQARTKTGILKLKMGELLVREGLIPNDAIQKVLTIQEESLAQSNSEYKPFGQICVDINIISRNNLKGVIEKFKNSISLGELLIKKNYITNQELVRMLDMQKVSGKRLGDLLIENQLMTETQLVNALSLQWDIPLMLPVLDLVDVTLLDKLDIKYMLEKRFLPVSSTSDEITVIMSDPNDEEVLDFLKKQFNKKVSIAIGSSDTMRSTLKEYYLDKKARLAESKKALHSLDQALESLTILEDDTPEVEEVNAAYGLSESEIQIAKEKSKEPEVKEDTLIVGEVSLARKDSTHIQQESMLNYIIKNALLDKATAIHIEPQGMFIRIRYRIDGVLHQKTSLPANLGNPMVARLKEICALNPDFQNIPQRNRVQASFNDQEMELGIGTYPSVYGETMVLTLRQKQGLSHGQMLNIEQIGFSPINLWRITKAVSQPGGLIIITGPARTGKTTTLYALLNSQNYLTKSICTAESPIEQTIMGITQGNWVPESGIAFSELIQSMSFLDPDLLMVSELDSPEIINTCIQLALNGIKIMSSYPSFDTMGALLRLSNQGLENYLIASNNVTLISQRLVRKLCPDCKVPENAHPDMLNLLGLTEVNLDDLQVFQAKGCETCQQLGYMGQVALHEVLTLNDVMREALLNQDSIATVRELARNEGRLISMVEDGFYKCIQGVTSLSEVQRVAFVNEYDSRNPRSAEDIINLCKAEDKTHL